MAWFRRPLPEDMTRPAKAPWRALRIVARGMCCPVGHTAPAATAAINARLNHFRETGFVASGGVPLTGGALFDVHVWGAERLFHMLRMVLDEVREAAPHVDASATALFLTAQEPARPGWTSASLDGVFAQLLEEERACGREYRHAQFHPCGKGGITHALSRCAALLTADGGPSHVILLSVDSLLNAPSIEHYLSQERLLTHTNADGFIPGEAAAALMLSAQSASVPGLWIEEARTAAETWRIEGDTPMRAEGLTQAIRAAAAGAGCQVADLAFHASGMTGESWYAKEVSLALSRCMERRTPHFPHLMVARSVGETGAASPLLTLAWLAGVMGRIDGGPGHSGLLHFAGDDGQRSALVVCLRP